jgi:hypothetical protein
MFSITLVHIGLGRVFTKRSSGAMVPPKEKKKKDLWESDLYYLRSLELSFLFIFPIYLTPFKCFIPLYELETF